MADSSSSWNYDFGCVWDYDSNGILNSVDRNIFVACLQAKVFYGESPTVDQVQGIYDSFVSTGQFTEATIVNLPEFDCADLNLDGSIDSIDANVYLAYLQAKIIYGGTPTLAQTQTVYNTFVATGQFVATTIRHVPRFDESSSQSSVTIRTSSSSSQSSPSSSSSVSSITESQSSQSSQSTSSSESSSSSTKEMTTSSSSSSSSSSTQILPSSESSSSSTQILPSSQSSDSSTQQESTSSRSSKSEQSQSESDRSESSVTISLSKSSSSSSTKAQDSSQSSLSSESSVTISNLSSSSSVSSPSSQGSSESQNSSSSTERLAFTSLSESSKSESSESESSQSRSSKSSDSSSSSTEEMTTSSESSSSSASSSSSDSSSSSSSESSSSSITMSSSSLSTKEMTTSSSSSSSVFNNARAIIPAMSNNTTPSPFVASASDRGLAYQEPYMAVDGDSSTVWSGGGGGIHWLKIDLGKAYVANHYSVAGAYSGGSETRDWQMQGSNDDSGWTTLDTQEDQSFSSGDPAKNYTSIGNANGYRYYRLYYTTESYPSVRVFQLYSDEESSSSSSSPGP